MKRLVVASWLALVTSFHDRGGRGSAAGDDPDTVAGHRGEVFSHGRPPRLKDRLFMRPGSVPPGWAIAVFGLMALGCRASLPSPALPERPPEGTPIGAPDGAGIGRVRLDVVGDPAQVEIVERRDYPWGLGTVVADAAGGLQSTLGEHVRDACKQTPCVLDMPRGIYELRFTQWGHQDTAFVTFGATPSYAVHAVGSRRPERVGLGTLGGLLAATAIMLVPIGTGLAVTSPTPDQPGDPGTRHAIGIALAGVGVAALFGTFACLANMLEADRSGPVRQWAEATTR